MKSNRFTVCSMKRSLLIVTALPQELDGQPIPHDAPVLFTGVGKVNAAIALTQAILTSPPDLVINFGTAGRVRESVHGLVEISRVIQRDMNAAPLAPRGQTPFDETPVALESGRAGVICGTGDSFVMSREDWLVQQQVDVVDMELFALALVCTRLGVSWRSYKYVTDDTNEDSAEDWQERAHHGRDLFLAELDRVL